jgi:hypothetical protein
MEQTHKYVPPRHLSPILIVPLVNGASGMSIELASRGSQIKFAIFESQSADTLATATFFGQTQKWALFLWTA